MTTAIKIISDTLPDLLPRATIPFAEDCLGLFFFGVSNAESRKNRVNPAAPLAVRGTGPTSFSATSMFTSVPANNYQTPFNIAPHSYTVGGMSNLGGLAVNGIDPGPAYGWLPFVGGSNPAALAATFYLPGGGYHAMTLASEDFLIASEDVNAQNYGQKFNALSGRATGIDICVEDGGPGGGVVNLPFETPTPAASAAQPINFGQPLYGGTGYSSLGFVYNRPLTPAELSQVYSQVRRIQAARTGLPL